MKLDSKKVNTAAVFAFLFVYIFIFWFIIILLIKKTRKCLTSQILKKNLRNVLFGS
jgi:hypothetical protein